MQNCNEHLRQYFRHETNVATSVDHTLPTPCRDRGGAVTVLEDQGVSET